MPHNPVVNVLLFDDLTDGGLTYFCQGLRAEIVHRLMRVPSVQVLVSDTPRPASDESSATVIVGGSVRAVGERVRIAARLTDVATGSDICADAIDGTLADLFETHEQVAELIALRMAE
jgi:TolB-like protein